MPLCPCCADGAVLVATLVAIVLLPAQFYDFRKEEAVVALPAPAPPPPAPRPAPPWPALDLLYLPAPDLLVTLALLILGLLIYVCEFVQRKIMERRIVKLNQYLASSLERLRVWDAQQEQLETTLKLVVTATSEYNLLLFLLLRQHRKPPDKRCYDKHVDEEIALLRNPSLAT